MDFVKCLENVKKLYKIYNENKDFFCVDCNKLLTDYEYIFIAIKNVNGNAVICDFANNLQNINIPEEKIKEICKKYDVIFNDYNLSKIYNSNNDLTQYINCILKLSKISSQE